MNQRSLRSFALVLLMAALLAVYWQTLQHGFINYDDQLYVTENQSVQAGLTTQGVAWAFTTFRASNWHPVTWLSHMLDVELFGLNPAGHHAVNLLLHAVNTLLLLQLLRSATRRWWPSLVVAGLFALHPLHVESVAWIAERKDLLSTLFLLLCLMAYGHYARTARLLPYLTALACFAVGLMAKPMLVTLPFALLLWDVWPLGRLAAVPLPPDETVEHRCPTVPLRRLLLEKVPFLLLTVGSCVITYLAQQQGGAVSGLKAVPLSFRIANALSSYTGYLAKTVWPTELAVIYPLPAVIPVAGAILSALVLVGVSALVLRQLRQRPWLAAGWFWYLGTLVPVIGLVQVGQQAMADRYTYIPLLGIFIMVAWGVADLCRRLRLPAPATSLAVVLMLGALALVTWRQASHWKDGITLFSHTTRVVAGNHVGYRLLGIALSREGRFAEAEQAFQAALRARPDDDDAITEWGINLKEAGRPAEAAQQFSEALRLNPSHLFARLHLAQLLKDEGRLPEAIREYQLLSRQYPDRYYVQNGLGSAYLEAGDTERALLHFRRALELDPANAEILYNLGLAAGMGGNMPASIDYLTRALALRPGFAEAHYNLGSALARSGDFGRAADHFAAALRINPAFAEARRALELARSRSGGSPP